MDPAIVGFIAFGIMILLVFTGLPIGMAMALVGFCGFAYIRGIDPALGLLKTVPYSTASNYTFSVMPMFVLMGEFAFQSGISKDLYQAAYKWFGRVPGGLAMSTIWAGAGFGAMCGSSAAATSTFASVALPEMLQFKYKPGFAAATISAAGTLAVMIPPSGLLIIYGVLTETSIGKLFIAGVLPGIVLATCYSIAIYYLCRRDPMLGPGGQSYPLGEKVRSLSGSWAMIVLFLFVMGGIYLGVFTPTEAGALGATGSMAFLIWRGKFNRKTIFGALTSAVTIVGMVMMIMLGAYIFGYMMAVTNMPLSIATWLNSLQVPPILIPLGIIVLYFFLGWVMDELTVVVLTTPLFLPILTKLGFDPIWWGIMCCTSMLQAQLTPPVALNINIICGITRDYIPMGDIFRAVMPYVLVVFVFGFVVLLFPDLSLWLPRLMK